MADRNFAAVLTAIRESPAVPAAHQDVLHAVVSAIAANDMNALESYFTEDIELHIHGFASLDGSWSGRDSVIATATRNYQKLAQQAPQIETMVEQGDNVVWLMLESGHLKEDGQRYEARGVIWWTFRGTQICRVEEFLHSKMTHKNSRTEVYAESTRPEALPPIAPVHEKPKPGELVFDEADALFGKRSDVE